MKCMYFLAPSLDSTEQVSGDLQDVGISEWMLHVICKDEAGLKSRHIQSSNWLETHDLIRDGLIGANFGLIGGVVLTGLFMFFEPFGPQVPGVVYFFLVVVATLFGAWVGGLTGIDSEHRKLRRFHEDIEAGKYLILIYVGKGKGETVKEMMRNKHPEARHVATDRHFINPFSRIRRRRRSTPTNEAYE